MNDSKKAGLMSHMVARTTFRFPKAGTYRFRTKAAEDYMSRITTTGDNNVLTLTVTVRRSTLRFGRSWSRMDLEDAARVLIPRSR